MDCWAAYDNDPSPGWPFFADIVHAGWYPYGFFECFEPGGGHGILGVSVTFIWVDTSTDLPTDVNGDGYLDTALVEIYYNDIPIRNQISADSSSVYGTVAEISSDGWIPTDNRRDSFFAGFASPL
jgi:hypothetical protein